MNLFSTVIWTILCCLVKVLHVSNAKEDYYKVLGVDKLASDKQIKKAFRKLALQYHPDKNLYKDTSLKFGEIVEAFDVLKDRDKRRNYDQNGHNTFKANVIYYDNFKSENFDFDDLLQDFDEDFFKDFQGDFTHHFDEQKIIQKKAGEKYEFKDINDFDECFKYPFDQQIDCFNSLVSRQDEHFKAQFGQQYEPFNSPFDYSYTSSIFGSQKDLYDSSHSIRKETGSKKINEFR